ncbi:Aldo/keto reductase [Hortaea werneckii]|uniref:NADP-dependent oxidoreductase domain-containing protein n=1 Tax=Hortaea werneckii TaxID=91943 RepID=A0A3M7DEP4_HORWE|nr:Aldo/keto reductase [Hortaea werneckii]KAI7722664.1 Aldo/keto reductase [Hortaea werneckii]RMY62426.1 hypothetical protein D0865_00445 [Hortaea werneckii]
MRNNIPGNIIYLRLALLTGKEEKMAFKTHRTLKLNTGSSIPVVGLGTWQSGPGEVRNAVYHALKCGYKHIDAAFVYGNEEEVGDGIRRALEDHVITREELFVTSKLWCTYHRNPQKCLDEGLEKLGLDYVDLYLMHWPVPMNPNGNHPLFPKHTDGTRDLDTTWSHVQTYKEMEKLLATGKAKAIGVSNYSVKYLEELLPKVDVVPAVNQIENHPLLPQQDIVDYCHWKGIVVEAFSPLGSTDSPLFSEDIVLEIAAKYGIGAGSVLISYQATKGHVVLPKSTTPSRIQDNLHLVDLDTSDMEALEKINKYRCTKRFVYPAFGVALGFPDKPGTVA